MTNSSLKKRSIHIGLYLDFYWYPLVLKALPSRVMSNSSLLKMDEKMAIENGSFPIENGGSFHRYPLVN